MTKRKRNLIKLIFTSFTVLLLVLIFSLSSIYKSYAMNEKEVYVEVVVENGDSLWTIARKHNNDEDIRKLIFEIEEINNLDQNYLQPGQVLLLPAN